MISLLVLRLYFLLLFQVLRVISSLCPAALSVDLKFFFSFEDFWSFPICCQVVCCLRWLTFVFIPSERCRRVHFYQLFAFWWFLIFSVSCRLFLVLLSVSGCACNLHPLLLRPSVSFVFLVIELTVISLFSRYLSKLLVLSDDPNNAMSVQYSLSLVYRFNHPQK